MAPRWLVYLWVGPNTLLGLLGVAIAVVTGGRARLMRGVIEAEGGLLRPILSSRLILWGLGGGLLAITVGHVILGASAGALDRARPHEHVHVRQYERWGPLFLPAYLVAGLIAWRTGGRFYRDNAFEREAYDSVR